MTNEEKIIDLLHIQIEATLVNMSVSIINAPVEVTKQAIKELSNRANNVIKE